MNFTKRSIKEHHSKILEYWKYRKHPREETGHSEANSLAWQVLAFKYFLAVEINFQTHSHFSTSRNGYVTVYFHLTSTLTFFQGLVSDSDITDKMIGVKVKMNHL